MEEETLELKVDAINENETLSETLDETRMELDELLNLLNKNFSVYDLDSSTYLTSENVSSFTSIDIPDANLQKENEQNSSINVTYSGPDSHYTSDELKAREDYFASPVACRYWIKLVGNSQTGCKHPWIAMKMNKEFLEKEGITDPENFDWSTSPYSWIRWWPGFKVDVKNAQVHSSLDENLEEGRYWSREPTPENSSPNSPRNSPPNSPRNSYISEAPDETNLDPVVSPPVTSVPPTQHKKFEFSSESGNNSMSNFQTSENTMVTLKRFDSDKFKSNFMDCENIVFDKNIWLSLIEKIPCGVARDLQNGCTGRIKHHDLKTIGELVTLIYKCTKCGSLICFSNVSSQKVKVGRAIPIESANLKIVMSHIFKGSTWENYMQKKALATERPMPSGVWGRCERFIRLTLSGMYSRHIEHLQNDLKKSTEIVLAADGSWRKRRESPNFVYVIMEATKGLIIHQEILSKKTVRRIADAQKLGEKRIIQIGESNYEGTSKGMEGYGFRKAMDTLEEKGILSKIRYLVTDEDSSVLSQIKNEPRYSKIQRKNDSGHGRKNLQKDFEGIAKKSELWKDYPTKISKWFLNSIMASRAYALSYGELFSLEEKLDLMKDNCVQRLRYWRSHYIQARCCIGCPCYYAYVRQDAIAVLPDTLVSWLRTVEVCIPDTTLFVIQRYLIGDAKQPRQKQDTITFYRLTSVNRAAFTQRRFQFPSWNVAPRPKPKFLDVNQKVRKNSKSNSLKIGEIGTVMNNLIANISVFIGFWSTCLCESFNALRTRFVPKDKPLVKYWRQQCELTALIWNKGSEEVVRELYQELGINVSPALDLLLRRQENKKRMEQIRHTGIDFKKREKQLKSQDSKQRGKDKDISKIRKDTYTSNSKKSTIKNLPSNPTEQSTSIPVPVPVPSLNPASAPITITLNQTIPELPSQTTEKKRKRISDSIDFSTLTLGQVNELKGHNLKEANEYFELKQKVGNEGSVASQRARIKEVLTEPNARQKYGHYFVKKRRTGES